MLYVMCCVTVTVGTRDTRQSKKKASVSMDTTTTTEGPTPADDVTPLDLTPER